MSRFRADAEVDPRDAPWAAGRSLLAAAQLVTLAFTPSRLLFFHLRAAPDAQCAGLSRLSLWCIGGQPQSHTPAMAFAVIVLVGVVVGLWPRWLCIPHWYVAFSIHADVIVVDGGAKVAAIVTLLLIPLCLGDDRSNHWLKTDEPMAPAWSGAAHASILLLRLQLAIVYLVAAVSKLEYSAWRNGSALLIISKDPQFGFPESWRPMADHLLSIACIGDVLTWSVPAVELTIACALLAPKPIRGYGLVLVILIHGAIMLAMGLVSFGVVMIASALLATLADDGRIGSRAGQNSSISSIIRPSQLAWLRVRRAVRGE